MKHMFSSPSSLLDFVLHHQRERAKIAFEWLIILTVAFLYAGVLLDFDSTELQQTGEHNESASWPLMAEIGLKRYGEIPLWNPYMQTGFPAAGDMLSPFWSPVSTLSAWIFNGINGMKVAVFLSFLLAGFGQWYLARVSGLRGLFRLWSSLLFMLSGGLALLWRVGWYALLVGAAWFPWAFASFWQSLHKNSSRSLVWAAFCSAMVLLTGGGYYPFYLLGSAGVILLTALVLTRSGRWRMLQRALVVAVLIGGLIAVMAVPILDGYRLIVREAGYDMSQASSQPIPYALMNYVVSAPEWFNNGVLGTAGGWNWYYLGPLSLAFLIFAPLIYRSRRRAVLIGITGLFIFLLAWHANRFSPLKVVYDLLPFLYQLRFPGRLLYIAASPLLIISGAGFQAAYAAARRKLAAFKLSLNRPDGTRYLQIDLRVFVTLAALVIAGLSLQDVFTVNQGIAFIPDHIDPRSFQGLSWLKNHDSEVYYTDLGPGINWWQGWITTAYNLEMPAFNFYYNQHVATKDAQQASDSPLTATPKYQFASMQEPAPVGGEFLREFDGVGLWYIPGALPFAFTLSDSKLASGDKVTADLVTPIEARYDGPNRVKATATSTSPSNETLVVLVSDYPGWQLQVDGQPAQLTPVNHYLGAAILPGAHTYTFQFDPPLQRLGLILTAITLVICLLMWIIPDARQRQLLHMKPAHVSLERRANQPDLPVGNDSTHPD